jgi:3-dehydroquinate synthase
MVDSSVGGKVGVNHRLGKNMIGAFYQPKFVVSDTNFLNTLPQREFVSGIGEVIKYGIVGDTQFFSFLENSLVNLSAQDPNVLQKIIFYCCRFKANIVCLDERDYNVRRTLNFGHTIGHSLETISGYKKFKHGEAVLLGMKAESYIANQLGILSDSLYRRFATLIDRIPIKVKVSDVPLESILKTMRLDKKNLESNFVFVLPREIGKMQVISSVPDKIIFNALRLLSK